jgi:hypothetical protein
LQLNDRAEDASPEPPLVSVEKKLSTAFSHEPEVGVKWKVQRGCWVTQVSTLGCLWVA